jgi:hypothetical protein
LRYLSDDRPSPSREVRRRFHLSLAGATKVSDLLPGENLAGDAKGKGTSGSIREAESTDALERGGLLRSSYEAGVMLAERRGQVIAVELGPTGYVGRSPKVQRKAAAFVRWHEPDDARVSSPVL